LALAVIIDSLEVLPTSYFNTTQNSVIKHAYFQQRLTIL